MSKNKNNITAIEISSEVEEKNDINETFCQQLHENVNQTIDETIEEMNIESDVEYEILLTLSGLLVSQAASLGMSATDVIDIVADFCQQEETMADDFVCPECQAAETEDSNESENCQHNSKN